MHNHTEQSPLIATGRQSENCFDLEEGFSLVELIVAIAVFATAVVVTATTFGGTSNMLKNSQQNNEINQAIDQDFAYVLRSNDRLTCNSGTCILADSDTDRNSYFPTVAGSGTVSSSQQANITFFEGICTSTNTSTGFAGRLSALLQPPDDSRIKRLILPAPGNSPSHLYAIRYTRTDDSFLRQNFLTPTTVSWCSALLP